MPSLCRPGRALVLGLLVAAGAVADAPPPAAESDRIAAALEAVRPALVQLRVVSQRFGDGRAQRFPSSGSGVVVTPRGDLLTNYHVAGHSARIQATLATGETLPAEVVAHDPLTDLSVLRLVAEGERVFPTARLAEREPEVGEPVLALGNPLTLASSVTLGIVSNARRVFTDFVGSRIEDLELDGEPTGLFTQWLQHDALILPGNSGGPLVALDGTVVGINELGGGGVGFAIPAGIARRVLEAALGAGRMIRADLGLTALPVAKLGRGTGALVASVDRGSPAESAGLEPGDVLLAIGGREVQVRFFEEVPELYRTIAELPIGEPVELTVERAGERLRLAATPVELEPAAGEEAEVPALGLVAQEVTSAMARARNVERGAGLLVTSLRAGTPAATAKPPVLPGDLLTRFDDRALSTLDDLGAALAAAADDRPAVIGLWRDGVELLSLVRPEAGRVPRSGGELPKAWLGIETQEVTPELAAALGSDDLSGFRVTRVLPWTTAESAGLRVGDVVTAIDGDPLESRRAQDRENLRRAIEQRAIGEEVSLSVRRAGDRIDVAANLEARPRGAEEARDLELEALGFAVREITQFDRVRMHLDRDQEGVVVTDVTSGGWAQLAGLETTDLLLGADGGPVASLADLEDAVRRSHEVRQSTLRLFVRRGARTHFLFLEPDWNGSVDPKEGS